MRINGDIWSFQEDVAEVRGEPHRFMESWRFYSHLVLLDGELLQSNT